MNYAPASIYASSSVSLLEPGSNSSTTSTPSFKVSGSYASDLSVAFEYRWKLSSSYDWSTPSFVLGALDAELNVDEEAANLYWAGTFSYEPRGLALGQVQVTVVASQWNPITRTYQLGTPQVVSFNHVAISVSAPSWLDLRLADDTGSYGDGVTANATIRGRLGGSDFESVSDLLVEYDVDGDGAPDGWTRTNASGEFAFTPELTPGSYTVRVRAARWDSGAGTEVAGVWQGVALTLVAAQQPAAPTIREFGPSTFLIRKETRRRIRRASPGSRVRRRALRIFASNMRFFRAVPDRTSDPLVLWANFAGFRRRSFRRRKRQTFQFARASDVGTKRRTRPSGAAGRRRRFSAAPRPNRSYSAGRTSRAIV